MEIPSHEQAFQVLLLQAADEGRAEALFGGGLARAREAVPPFLIGKEFPGVYLEHPLVGDPFLDVTVLLGPLEPGTRVASPAAGEHCAMLDFYALARREHDDVTCGFEVDTGRDTMPEAAIHFQPRAHTGLVRPFCEAVGEPQAADLYLGLAGRMPRGWQPSFLGMFRGRPGAPLRVCGYLAEDERDRCAADPGRLAEVLGAAGFTAHDGAMLSQASALMAAAPGVLDFQLDVYPDGRLGPTFALDVEFGIERPEAVRQSFEHGAGAAVMGLLEGWGAADGRWREAVRSAFARALPVGLDGGGVGRYALTLMPQWAKARWTGGELQPSKLYHFAHAGLVG